MARFDRVIIADWSASSALSPARPSADAIWVGFVDAAGHKCQYFRSRQQAEAAIKASIDHAIAEGQRLLVGFDFPMGYPLGFAGRLTGTATAQSVWSWLTKRITDGADNRNNRFDVAQTMNLHFGGSGPFWGRPNGLQLAHLAPVKSIDYPRLGLSERRMVETVVPRAQPVWKLYTTGAAGSQGLMGQPMIHRLCQRPEVSVWPFDRVDTKVVLAEVYPSLLAKAVAADASKIKDEAQVRLLALALFRLAQHNLLSPLLVVPECAAPEEGWILGAGHQHALEQALEWK